MLSQVRNSLKGAVAWFVIILLILAFMFWGVPNVSQLAAGHAISVGSENFTQSYVQSEFNRVLQAQRLDSGGALSREEALASNLDDQVVATITTTSALDQFADKMRLAVPRDLVRDYLQDNENFKNPATGRFDATILQSILQQNGITVGEFERRISENLKRNQLIDALSASANAPDPFVEALILRDTERRQIAYLIVTEEMAGKAAEPTPTDLEEFYQANAAVFTAPEYRTFDLLVLKSEDFRKEMAAPEEELRKIYDLNKARLYDKPELRTIYQITYDSETAAQAAVAALRQGKPFENLASERGLSLNAVTFADAQKRDILDPAVAEAAFSSALEEGSITDPVQSSFGWTVVQIAGITPPETSSFEDMRDEIEAQYLDQDTRRAVLNAVDLVEEARDTGASLKEAAAEAGLEAQSFGPVDRVSFAPGGAIIDNIPGEALVEAFRLDEGEESESLELATQDGYFFVSLREITPPALKPFELVRDEVETRWRAQERQKRVAAAVRSIREAVEGGQSLEEAAGQFDRTPTELVIDRRFQNEAISSAFNDQIFSAAKGELVSGPAALGEAEIIAEIRQVGFAPNRIPPDQIVLLEQYLGYQLDQELADIFVTAVLEDYKVEVNQAQIDAIFNDNI